LGARDTGAKCIISDSKKIPVEVSGHFMGVFPFLREYFEFLDFCNT